jgi:UrcA family protein
MMSLSKRCVIAIATCSIAALSGAAVAADWSDDVPTVAVSYGDLNLDRAEGAATLYRRIRAGASYVCRSLESRDVDRELQWERCIHEATAKAVAKVDEPVLTAYYRAKNPEHSQPATVTAKN